MAVAGWLGLPGGQGAGMNLVTTCPRCRTSFRVVTDQLRLRGGLVRCGACDTVFSGLDTLRRPQEPAGARPDRRLPTAAPSPRASADAPCAPYAPHAADAGPEDYAPSRAGIDDGATTFAGRGDATAEPVQGFMEQGVEDERDADQARPNRTRAAVAPDVSRILQLAAVVILAAALPLQLVIGNRDWLAARFAALEPAIQSLVSPLGLAIEAPRSLDTLSIPSFEMRPATQPGVFSVSGILRNDASHQVRWPSMLLTLTDGADQVLVRRIIDPAEYLGGDRQTMELRGRSERQLRFALEGDTLQARRSSVVLFYR